MSAESSRHKGTVPCPDVDVFKKQLEDVLERISDAFVALDNSWRYTYVNQHAAALFGRRPEDLVGKHIWTEFPEGVGQPFHLAYEKAMAEQVFVEIESYYPPWDRWFENRIYPSPEGVSIFFHDITDWKRADRYAHQNAALLKAQNTVLESIARGDPLQQTLDTLLRQIEMQFPAVRGSILLLDSDGVHLRHGAAPSLPDSFTGAIDGTPVDAGANALGAALARKEPVVVEDIERDSSWGDCRRLAIAHGLRSCWALPILDEQQRALGTLALYFDIASTPTPRHYELLELATHSAAIAIVRHREAEERARAADETKRREALLAEAQRVAHLGSFEWYPRTNEVLRSEELARIFGVPLADVAPTLGGYLERVHPEDRRTVDEKIQASLRDRTPYEYEGRIVRPDGSTRLLLSQGHWVFEDGEPVKLVGIAQDVTDRRNAERELRESEERFRIVARATNDAIWDWNPVNNSVWWNQGITTLFGYSADEVRPHLDWWYQHVHPDDIAGVVERIRRVAKDRANVWSGEYRFRRRDGSYANVLDRGFVIYDAAGNPIRMIGAMADISERKQAMDTLEQRVASRTAELNAKNHELETEIAERKRMAVLLQSRNEELKAFAYTVSHDLKAPLRGIAGYAQELERSHASELDDRARLCLSRILTATHNLDDLIEDLLQYSRLDAETPTPTCVNLAEMIDAILRDQRPVIVDAGTEVAVHLEVKTVRAWERGLHQVLANLIDNALKYSGHVSRPRIEIRSERVRGLVRITVADNGIGFDIKYHDRIFGLFNRLVRQEDFEGTGAGLAIVKKVVEKMQGRLRAESAPDAGATFVVELPESAQQEPQ
jgi:PAS domain S-box-containing protein